MSGQPLEGDLDGERRAVDEGLLLGELDEGLAQPLAGAEGAPVVAALVGSAGGIDAVMHVLRGLPKGFGACVLVLVHAAPDHASRLADILRARSAMRVLAARDGLPLAAGTVVVAPAGSHLLVTPQRRALLILCGEFPPNRPSADLLLATLATAVGPRAIAVILSGGGNDGATGATAVHALGGVVLTSDEATSAVFGMPQAAIERDDIVDRVLPLDQIAPALIELVAGIGHTDVQERDLRASSRI